MFHGKKVYIMGERLTPDEAIDYLVKTMPWPYERYIRTKLDGAFAMSVAERLQGLPHLKKTTKCNCGIKIKEFINKSLVDDDEIIAEQSEGPMKVKFEYGKLCTELLKKSLIAAKLIPRDI